LAPRNRLTSIETTRADTDLDGAFDAEDFSASTVQSLSIGEGSNRLLRFTQTQSRTQGTRTLACTSANVAYSLGEQSGSDSNFHDAGWRPNQILIEQTHRALQGNSPFDSCRWPFRAREAAI